MAISATLRRQVIERAGNRCEYCRLAQTGQEATFHIDHVVPVVGGGKTAVENLALACVSCSLRKGGRMLSRDPQTGEHVVLFNPRVEANAFSLAGRLDCGNHTHRARHCPRAQYESPSGIGDSRRGSASPKGSHLNLQYTIFACIEDLDAPLSTRLRS
jgi:hypothetical protein